MRKQGRSESKSLSLGKEIQGSINQFYKEYIKERYHRTSFLELEFKKLYLALMMPSVRMKDNKEKAAKKRYTGLLEKEGEEELEITGLEAILGD